MMAFDLYYCGFSLIKLCKRVRKHTICFFPQHTVLRPFFAEVVHIQISFHQAVGVGTLAGSTIMLLTLPFAGSLISGRCDLGRGGSVSVFKITIHDFYLFFFQNKSIPSFDILRKEPRRQTQGSRREVDSWYAVENRSIALCYYLGKSLTKTGGSVFSDVPVNARIMMLTTLPYFIIQSGILTCGV